MNEFLRKSEKEKACSLRWDLCSLTRNHLIYNKDARKKMTDEQKKIEKLYELLDELEEKKDDEKAGALRWAIFKLEQEFGQKL